jgi:biotin carboxyl carrier protein
MKVTVKIDDRIYNVEIQDINKRPIKAVVDGETFEIHPETELGASTLTTSASVKMMETATQAFSGKTLLAPLPGTVTEIFVLPGAKVETGQPVCVIEAMKMKNTIRAHRNGKVVSVPINPGQSVKHKQVLVEFADE